MPPWGSEQKSEDEIRAEVRAELEAERDAERAADKPQHFTQADDASPHRALHDDDPEPAPIFAREHPSSGKLVLDETATLNAAGEAVLTDDEARAIESRRQG